MTNLDVLLIESRPGITARTTELLEMAGHRVHRCHDDGEPGFPCKAITDSTACPIDDHVDVALVVRPRIAPRPTSMEDGVSCAIRAGIPIVEQGTDVLDPFGPWVARRIHSDDDVVAACVEAVEFADSPLRREIKRRIAQLLHGAAIGENDVTVRVVHDGPNMEVHLDMPGPADRRLEHALSVRVLDAVRSTSARTVGHTDVFVHRT
jgi:hypothetical protein